MALIVEDGTGLSTAESYISVADADTYHSDQNNTSWASLSTPAKEANLRKATEFMIGKYRMRWLGTRMKSSVNQALDWPRAYVYTEPFLHGAIGEFPYLVPDNIVPKEVKNACAELALRASIAPLGPDLGQKVLQKTVGPITVKYDPNSSDLKRYVAITEMLRVYLKNTSSPNMLSLVRT